MDISSWTQLNPTVKQVHTKKKFFNQYLYKAVVHTPGCRILNDNKTLTQGVAVNLQRRIDILSMHRGYTGYFRNRAQYLLDNARVDQLEYWFDVKNNFKDIIKIRIEEPNLSIYSNDVNQLNGLVKNSYPSRLIEIHAPENSASIDILNRGEIIVKKHPEFQYKILIKENGIRDPETKHNLLDFLYNLDKQDEVCLTKGIVKHLGSKNMWFPGGYFYAKDEKIITFINLIAPDCIAGIYKLANPDL